MRLVPCRVPLGPPLPRHGRGLLRGRDAAGDGRATGGEQRRRQARAELRRRDVRPAVRRRAKDADVAGLLRRLPLRVPRDRRSDATLRRRVGVELHGFDVRRVRHEYAVARRGPRRRRRALFPPERRAARLRRLLRAGRAAGPDLARGALPALDPICGRGRRAARRVRLGRLPVGVRAMLGAGIALPRHARRALLASLRGRRGPVPRAVPVGAGRRGGVPALLRLLCRGGRAARRRVTREIAPGPVAGGLRRARTDDRRGAAARGRERRAPAGQGRGESGRGGPVAAPWLRRRRVTM